MSLETVGALCYSLLHPFRQHSPSRVPPSVKLLSFSAICSQSPNPPRPPVLDMSTRRPVIRTRLPTFEPRLQHSAANKSTQRLSRQEHFVAAPFHLGNNQTITSWQVLNTRQQGTACTWQEPSQRVILSKKEEIKWGKSWFYVKARRANQKPDITRQKPCLSERY